MKVSINCKNCNIVCEVPQKEVKRGNGKFCSLKCSHEFRKKQPKIEKDHNCICAKCEKTFYKNKSSKKISKSGLYFCSRKCKDEAQRIGGIKEIQPGHYGKGNNAGYYRKVTERAGLMHECQKCGYNKIPSILQVHHKDRNRENNDISNLEVLCPNCHLEDHYLNNDGLFTKHKGGRECLECSSALQVE